MDRRVETNRWRQAVRAGALALAGCCAGCANISDPAGFAIVTQDKYDFMSCKEIVAQRAGPVARIKQLEGYVEKANASPGGFFVSANAYGSELAQNRALLRANDRAAQMNKCELPKP